MDSPTDFLSGRLDDVVRTMQALVDPELLEGLARAVDAVLAGASGGGRLFFLGNGGSAADAAHLAAEFVGRCTRERRPFPALALPEAAATVTALGNDYGYAEVFARQVEAWVGPGDVVVGLSTSGRSVNVLRALAAARARGAVTVGFGGGDGGDLPAVCDILLVAPATSTARIQEVHQVWGHLLAEWVDERLGD